ILLCFVVVGTLSLQEGIPREGIEKLLTHRQQTVRRIKARFLEALQTNNTGEVPEILYTTNMDIHTVLLEVEDKRMVLASYKQGRVGPECSWVMALPCVMYNSLETALVLLQKRAADNRKPNGKTLLHVACTVAHGDRGNVNKPSQSEDEDIPLHTAARLGIPELVALYISHGAQMDVVNSLQEMTLITAAFWNLDRPTST
ncbi:unnamed protein product, partial [Coregonus sp. 'balchen']